MDHFTAGILGGVLVGVALGLFVQPLTDVWLTRALERHAFWMIRRVRRAIPRKNETYGFGEYTLGRSRTNAYVIEGTGTRVEKELDDQIRLSDISIATRRSDEGDPVLVDFNITRVADEERPQVHLELADAEDAPLRTFTDFRFREDIVPGGSTGLWLNLLGISGDEAKATRMLFAKDSQGKPTWICSQNLGRRIATSVDDATSVVTAIVHAELGVKDVVILGLVLDARDRSYALTGYVKIDNSRSHSQYSVDMHGVDRVEKLARFIDGYGLYNTLGVTASLAAIHISGEDTTSPVGFDRIDDELQKVQRKKGREVSD